MILNDRTREDPVAAKILRALEGPENLWRTPGGIARETGLSQETVEVYLRDHPELFSQSPIRPGGTSLYSTHAPTQSSSS